MNDLYKTGSMIENFLSMLLTKAKISSIISFDETPLTISSDSTDMIVVDVLSVNDYGGEAKCSANIFLYAKSTDSSGSKPVKKLFDMEKTLFSAIDQSDDKHFVITSRELIGKESKSSGNFYCNVYNIGITIR